MPQNIINGVTEKTTSDTFHDLKNPTVYPQMKVHI